MRICKVEGCERNQYCKGYCKKHYQRSEAHGDPLCTKIEMHGMCVTLEYKTWQRMKDRCYNQSSKRYHRYGGRGITVCNKWLGSFMSFLKDMGKKPFPRAQIDRIDNDGNYEPGNCRWVTITENVRNGSRVKLNMQKAEEIRKLYKAGGILQREISLVYGVKTSTIGNIINNYIWV